MELVGNCVVVDHVSKKLMLSDKILKLTFTDEVDPYFILYFTQSQLYRNQIEQLSSGNQMSMRNVSQANLKKVKFRLPSVGEQKEIVKILNSYTEKMNVIADSEKKAMNEIDDLQKVLLSKAFRGELHL